MKLSDREKEVMEYILEGSLDKEIACKLGISLRTVHTYKARIFAKLGVRNKTCACISYLKKLSHIA